MESVASGLSRRQTEMGFSVPLLSKEYSSFNIYRRDKEAGLGRGRGQAVMQAQR